jgi:alginate O-acetyltransferase complex protein AlgI
MSFNSSAFLFVFLPVCLLGFFSLARWNRGWAKIYLLLSSFVFYDWSNIQFVSLLVGSIVINYYVGNLIQAHVARGDGAKVGALCSFGILANLALLFYFKYMNFFLDTLDIAIGAKYNTGHIILPLGISFYSFQRIAYLIDCARGDVRKSSFLNFSLFAVFFPQLISGPITLYNEIAPQFEKQRFFPGARYNLMVGIVIFAIGLFKKTVIADNVAYISDPLFDAASRGTAPDILSAWFAALSYTAQLYFDFSGYSDMAIGVARMFGILLPLNFHSPLRAANIMDYWRRWHMTLTRFMLNYLYLPLSLVIGRYAFGGSLGTWQTYMVTVAAPVFLTFLLVGIWHGAGWTFVVFGLMHATYVSTSQAWREFRKRRRRLLKVSNTNSRSNVLGQIFAHALTIVCVILGNIMFRSDHVATAGLIYKGMLALTRSAGPALPEVTKPESVFFIALGWFIIAVMPNTQQIMRAYHPAVNWRQWEDVAPSPITLQWRPNAIGLASIGMLIAIVITATLIGMNREPGQFIYFQF